MISVAFLPEFLYVHTIYITITKKFEGNRGIGIVQKYFFGIAFHLKLLLLLDDNILKPPI